MQIKEDKLLEGKASYNAWLEEKKPKLKDKKKQEKKEEEKRHKQIEDKLEKKKDAEIVCINVSILCLFLFKANKYQLKKLPNGV